jgi:flagellar FliJ protein
VAACVYTMYTTYQVHLKKTENQAQQRLTQAERVVERQRRRVVAASKDRKVMDKYKERKKEAYEERQRSAEQVQLDEMAMLARLRRNDEE